MPTIGRKSSRVLESNNSRPSDFKRGFRGSATEAKMLKALANPVGVSLTGRSSSLRIGSSFTKDNASLLKGKDLLSQSSQKAKTPIFFLEGFSIGSKDNKINSNPTQAQANPKAGETPPAVEGLKVFAAGIRGSNLPKSVLGLAAALSVVLAKPEILSWVINNAGSYLGTLGIALFPAVAMVTGGGKGSNGGPKDGSGEKGEPAKGDSEAKPTQEEVSRHAYENLPEAMKALEEAGLSMEQKEQFLKRLDGAFDQKTGYEKFAQSGILNSKTTKKIIKQAVKAKNPSEIYPFLKDNRAKVRRYAIEALGKLQDKQAVPELIKLMKDSSLDVQLEAIYTLGFLKASEAIPELLKYLVDGNDAYAQIKAAEAIAKIGDPKAIPELTNLLQNSRARVVAEHALREFKNSEAVSEVIDFSSEFNPLLRQGAAIVLGALETKINDPKAFSELSKLILDLDPSVRERAASGLGDLGDIRGLPELTKALTDVDPKVRGRAAIALGFLGSSEATPKLINALSDKDAIVRFEAANALGFLGDPKAVPELIKALADHDVDVRTSAAQALGNLGDSRAIPPLIWLSAELKSRGLEPENYFDQKIDTNPPKDLQDVFLAVQRITYEENMLFAITREALDQHTGPKAAPELIKLSKSENPWVRLEASGYLIKLGEQRGTEELRQLLKHENSKIRASAKEILTRSS